MSAPIDPLILSKLAAFSERRRKLIVRRGIYAAVATLLLTMMGIALIDALFVLPESVRWGLSLAAYATVLGVEWWSCWRLLLKSPDHRQLARLVEHAEPKLREDLLSAVELGETSSDQVLDSPQFRALLQADVAERMGNLEMERLLPAHLVRRSMVVMGIIFVGFIAAFSLSGGQFGTLLLRALAPGANLDRVSRVKVKIIEPTRADMLVPQGETVPLIVEISGQKARTAEVQLETLQGNERLKMVPVGENRFSASIQVGREDVLYRVQAGDALTRKFRLQVATRPHVVEFQKTYTYPSYAKLEPKQSTEDQGNVAGLEGAQVELRLKPNQKIREAELRVDQGKKSYTVPLTAQDDLLVAKLPLDASGSYRVHLVAADTGFENKFSPEYELRAEPDLVPQVDLTLPEQDLFLAANEVVEVEGTATDDLALAKVSQLLRINDGDWKEIPLAQNPGAKATVTHRWDLYEQGVKAGDLLTVKLMAIDLKGSRAESRPRQITVTETGFESSRLGALAGQRELYRLLKDLRTAGEAMEKSAREAREQFERLPETDQQRVAVATGIAGTVTEFQAKLAEAAGQLTSVLRESEPGHLTADYSQIARWLSRIQVTVESSSRAFLTEAVTNPSAQFAREWMREFHDQIGKVGHLSRRLEEVDRVILLGEELAVVSENSAAIFKEQTKLWNVADKAEDDVRKWAGLVSRQRVILAEVSSLKTLIGESVKEAGDRFRGHLERLDRERPALEGALNREPSKQMREPMEKTFRALEDFNRSAFDGFRDLVHRSVRGPMDLRREMQMSAENLDDLKQDLQRIEGRRNWPDEVRSRLLASRWDSRGRMLKGHGDAEEARPDADSYFVNDVRKTTLALEALANELAGTPHDKVKPRLEPLEQGFRVLESGHNIAEVATGFDQLAVVERWEMAGGQARTSNPRDWEGLEDRLRAVMDELGRSKFQAEPLREVVRQAQQILAEAQRLPAWQTASREMKERMGNRERAVQAVPVEVEQVAAQVRLALDLFRQPMADARKTVEELTPKLSQMMQNLAKKADDLQKKTEEQKNSEKPPEQKRAEAQQALAEQQALNEKIEDLKDALRAEANQQNILEAEGRERARDVDDALALLKDPPPDAETALSDAAAAEQPAMQKEALAEAAKAQEKLTDALQQLADHFENVEEGDPSETRLALRKTEEQTGIKESMERQAQRAEELGEMAKDSPEEMLKTLEKALPKNAMMRQELSEISKSTLESASQQLTEASNRGQQVAEEVKRLAEQEKQAMAQTPPTPPAPSPDPAATPADPNAPKPADASGNQPMPPQPQSNPALAEAARKQQPVTEAAKSSGENVARVGRHEQRLANTEAGKKLEALGNEVAETADQKLASAQNALTKSPQAMQAEAAVKTATDELKAEASQLAAAAQKSQASEAAAPQPAPGQNESSPAPAAPQEKSTAATSPSQSASPAGEAATSPQAPKPGDPASAAEQMAKTQSAPGAPNAGDPAKPQGNMPMPGAAEQPAMSMQEMLMEPKSLMDKAASQASLSPQEQVWMARMIDALDAALHSEGNSAEGEGKEQQANGQQQADANGKPSDKAAKEGEAKSKAMAQAKQAMNAAAQAAAASAKESRSSGKEDKQGSETAQGKEQMVSRGGAKAQGSAKQHGALGEAKNKAGDWGKLPKQMAEQLNRGQNENVAGEYRNQVETYYRVIAEKSKKQ